MGKVKGKCWKSGGPEDKFIIKLIQKKEITKKTKPSFLKDNYPDRFGDFSLQVIRNHLNELKRTNGLYCKFLIGLLCLLFVVLIYFMICFTQ